jgi:protein-L-isoaspartate(D-aspartate) O-methyltransferase
MEQSESMRAAMVHDQLIARGIRDPLVLAAMRWVPRHEFVPADLAGHAYADCPLPIGGGKTISQPYVVAAMTELARVRRGARVLDVGTGSGYQAAVLAAIGAEVWTIEIDEVLAYRAVDALARAGLGQIHVRVGDGSGGWPEAAPFDAIIVAAAPRKVPAPLREQLAIGGRMVIPVGGYHQELMVITRVDQQAFAEEYVFPVAFVPMTGAAETGWDR